jgi:hypothetical protein
MLLRVLQKGLTFHNISLMPRITAQDDENVVYSKQMGVEESSTRAPERPEAQRCRDPVGSPGPKGCLCPGRAWAQGGIKVRQTPTLALAGFWEIIMAIVQATSKTEYARLRTPVPSCNTTLKGK